MADLLIVLDNVSQVIPSSIMSLSDRHRIMGKIHIAVVAEEFRHVCNWPFFERKCRELELLECGMRNEQLER